MEKYLPIAQLFLFCSLSIFLISCSFYLFGNLKIKRYKNKIDTFTISTSESEEVLLHSLDQVITDTLDEYTFLEIENNTSFIINDDSENKITKDVSNRVIDNMSAVMYDGLCLIFSKEKIPRVISYRVYAKVVDYLTKKRSELED